MEERWASFGAGAGCGGRGKGSGSGGEAPGAAASPCNADDVAPFVLRALGLPTEPMPMLVDDAMGGQDDDPNGVIKRLRTLGYLE